MAKLRLLFTKEAQASYISHLDTMRTFQRVFPRAELHLKHSNGFHPHPIISIVLPLPVGQSSDCELLDFETVEETDGAGIAEKLNTGLPAGLRVRECYPVTRPVREFTFLRARLELLYDNGVPAGTADALRALFARETLMIEKRTKHKELAQIDTAPLIREMTPPISHRRSSASFRRSSRTSSACAARKFTIQRGTFSAENCTRRGNS